MSLLNQLTKITSKKAKRIGRGLGSGRGGHTSTRGAKGQLSRSGANVPLWFEGGQLPLIKRLPMWRGKDRLHPINKVAEVRLVELNQVKSDKITLDALKLARVIPKNAVGAKIIGNTEVTKKYTIVAPVRVTAGAKKVIIAAGGLIE